MLTGNVPESSAFLGRTVVQDHVNAKGLLDFCALHIEMASGNVPNTSQPPLPRSPFVAPDLPSPASRELIRLDARAQDKTDAIAQVAQMLVASGCVAPGYEASMGRRETLANTFLGHGVAIPHGLGEDRHLVHRDGIAVLQLPQGVEWNRTGHPSGGRHRCPVGYPHHGAAPLDPADPGRVHAAAAVHHHRGGRDRERAGRRCRDCRHPRASRGSGRALRMDHRLPQRTARPSCHALGRDGARLRSPRAGPRRRSGGRCQESGSAASARAARGRCRACFCRGRRCPALLAALRKVMDGLVAQERADAERAAQRKAAACRRVETTRSAGDDHWHRRQPRIGDRPGACAGQHAGGSH